MKFFKDLTKEWDKGKIKEKKITKKEKKGNDKWKKEEIK